MEAATYSDSAPAPQLKCVRYQAYCVEVRADIHNMGKRHGGMGKKVHRNVLIGVTCAPGGKDRDSRGLCRFPTRRNRRSICYSFSTSHPGVPNMG